MWQVNGGNQLIMYEGDYNINLPFIITNVTVGTSSAEKIIITIRKTINSEALITKEYANVSNNTVVFVLTAADTALLPAGNYVYSVQWVKTGTGAFSNTIIPAGELKVVAHA